MRSRNQRKRTVFGFEAMEGRVALSGVGGLDDGPRHDARDQAEVRHARGTDDGGGHDTAKDDRGSHKGTDQVKKVAVARVDHQGSHQVARPQIGRPDDHGKHPVGHR